jgi:hypothetical protein
MAPSGWRAPDAGQFAEVQALRQRYVLENDDVAPEILAGFALPPASWINDRLSQEHLAWRIGDVHGRTFDVMATPK